MKVTVTLVKSLIGAKPAQKATAAALGLRKIGDSFTSERDAVLNGQLNVVSHLVKIDEQ